MDAEVNSRPTARKSVSSRKQSVTSCAESFRASWNTSSHPVQRFAGQMNQEVKLRILIWAFLTHLRIWSRLFYHLSHPSKSKMYCIAPCELSRSRSIRTRKDRERCRVAHRQWLGEVLSVKIAGTKDRRVEAVEYIASQATGPKE